MTMLLPCASRKFAAQSRRLQQSPRPTIRRLTAKALPPTKTTAAAKTSSSPPATSATSPSPPPAAAAAAAPKPAPTAAVIGAPELSLLFTAALWGSYAPALRFLFSLDQPPTPATLTAARAVVQAGLLLAFAAAAGAGGAGGAGGGASPPAAAAGTPKKEGWDDSSPPSSSSSSSTTSSSLSPLAKFMKTPSPSLLTAGMELGVWNLAAAAFHAAGLSRTSATEAAFVVCATGLLTPLYAAAAGERQGARVWAGCGVALLGALALSLDKTGGGGMGSSEATSMIPLSTSLAGDAFVLCAAAFYSAATFRLSVLAPVHASGPSGSSNSPQALAAAKSAAFAVGAVAWALSSGALFSGADQGGLASLLPSAASASAADGGGNPLSSSFAAPLVLAWAALGPGALAAVLQSRGQARVPAGRAQALFATVPLWSAALAGVALGERTGAAGWSGGLLIVAGGALAATAPREEEE